MIATIMFMVSCEEHQSDVPIQELPQGVFKNPVLDSGPDPWVVKSAGYYYVTHTTGNSIRLYRTQKMSRLSSAEVKTVWTPPETGMNAENIWAPELHFILDKWYLYYAADDGNNENHRIWVLENADPDPFEGTWVDKGQLQLPDDKWAIDGTLFSPGDAIYFAWSGWEQDVNDRQNIYIAQMSDPWTVTSDRVMLSTPELAWEMKGGPPYVNEAPQFIAHEGSIFLTYSASGCWTDDYSIGLLSTPATSDLLDADAWEKSAQPVLQKDFAAQTFGPGHNAFFKSLDGTEDWIIYHANGSANGDCDDARSMRMQKFTWVAGKPQFGPPATLGAQLPVPAGEK